MKSVFDAIRVGDIKHLENFLTTGGNQNETRGDGETLLALASKAGNKEMVEILLQAGATLEGATRANHTPLLNAVKYNRYEVAKLLLQKGADTEAVNWGGSRALEFAISKKNEEMVKLLLKYGTNVNRKSPSMLDETPLLRAYWTGNEKIVRLLLAYGADPNEKLAGKKFLFQAYMDMGKIGTVLYFIKFSSSLCEEGKMHLRKFDLPVRFLTQSG